ncbi:hypothetical protein EUGRSUZ_B00445 [Eucalyptus grandis]|uniref:Uncharacterized protein n=2 Tax=Eucalyptus grandis TaxID=71139 RepID=A0A059CZB2_EUCGR|nr:hypothetical protein EUGRSUZ_B00445 [Eucalyptus grandis]
MDRSCELAMLVKAKQTLILQFSAKTKFVLAATTELCKISSQRWYSAPPSSPTSCTPPRSSATPGHLRPPPPHEGPPLVRHMKKVIQMKIEFAGKHARIIKIAAKGLSSDFFEISIGGFTFTFRSFIFTIVPFCKSQC